MANNGELWTLRLGTIPWIEAMEIQERIRALRQADRIADTLILLEHPPTVTLGRRSGPADLPRDRAELEAAGVAVHQTDRGGRLTCHEPGQLVAYPIMRTDDVVGFVRSLERTMIGALAGSGVTAGTRDGLTGVWCGERKIGSIGIHVQRGVTTHGFAINCDNDLGTFEGTVPCGLPDVEMTSIAREGGDAGIACLRHRVGHALASEHGLRQRLIGPARVGIEARIAPVTACREAIPA